LSFFNVTDEEQAKLKECFLYQPPINHEFSACQTKIDLIITFAAILYSFIWSLPHFLIQINKKNAFRQPLFSKAATDL